MSRWLWRWAPVGAQMATIFAFSGQTDVPPLPGGLSGYTGHVIGYAILGALSVRAFAGAAWLGVTARAASRAVILSSAYGVTDELHQSFVANRFPGADDWLADTIGAVIAVVAVLTVAHARRSRERPARGV